MRFARRLIPLAFILCSVVGWSQNTRIVIAAGTPEDKDLTAIAAEQDPQKRIALYQDFVNKYASNKAAAAYGDWQLSQQYLAAGDTAKALEQGDRALELYPNDLDIIVSQIGITQTTKDAGKTVDYAVRGAEIHHSIATQPKPNDVTDADWKARIADDQDAGKRMNYIEKFTPAFPNSKFEEQVSQLALYSLQQLNQPERLETYG